jgi:hypothetical protein
MLVQAVFSMSLASSFFAFFPPFIFCISFLYLSVFCVFLLIFKLVFSHLCYLSFYYFLCVISLFFFLFFFSLKFSFKSHFFFLSFFSVLSLSQIFHQSLLLYVSLFLTLSIFTSLCLCLSVSHSLLQVRKVCDKVHFYFSMCVCTSLCMEARKRLNSRL